MQWLVNNWPEFFGVISGLLFLYFEYKENTLLWPVGIITSAMYIYVFFKSKFYADMSLQGYYLVVGFYGWYYWARGGKKGSAAKAPILKTSNKLWIILLLVDSILFCVLYLLLKHFTDSPVPLGDAFVTSLSIVATWMLTKKYIEQWFLWIASNGISVMLFMNKVLYFTASLYIVYTIISIAGYFKWKKEFKKQLT